MVEGSEPAPGVCAGCGALYAGGSASPPLAVADALSHWGAGDLAPDALALRLFEVEPLPSPAPTAAITSDQRDDFYLWWVFVRPGEQGVGAVFQGLLGQ